MIPVSSPYASLQKSRSAIDAGIRRVLDRGQFVLGPEVESLENEFARFVGTPFAVGVNSGTDALSLTLQALGVGAGDEVITVSFTAVATVAAIEQAGATPVLVDVSEDTLTMDVSQVHAAITSRTRAVVPVHLYGNVCDLTALKEICDRSNLALVEDCSQAHGSIYESRHVGSVGVAGVFSCYPTKNLGALGDAGLVATSDCDLARRLRRIRQYGWEERNVSLDPGVNSRLDEIQAAVLRVKLTRIGADIDARRQIAAAYDMAFSSSEVQLIHVADNSRSSYHLYVVRHPERDSLRQHLSRRGIESAIHYPHPVHQQPAYVNRVRVVSSMNVSGYASSSVLSIPMYPELRSDQVAKVVEAAISWRC